MILLTDHYDNQCLINPEYLSIAYIPQKETETQVLLTDGARIFVKESPAEIYARMYEDDEEFEEEDDFDPWQPEEEKSCNNCANQDTPSNEYPCDVCIGYAPGSEDGLWTPKKDTHHIHTGDAAND